MKKFLLLASLFLAVQLRAGVLTSELFQYPDGAQIATEPNWTAHSGAGSLPLVVSNSLLQVNLAGTEDDSLLIPGSPYNPANHINITNLYASFTLNCSTLPGAIEASLTSGNYFAHFKDTSLAAAQTNGFRCRLFAHTNNAADGKFRLGITSVNGGATGLAAAGFTQYPVDLSTNTAYTVVMTVDTTTGQSILWVNPNSPTDLAVTNSDPSPGTPVDLSYFAFRQSGSGTGPGLMQIGKLKIGTLFTDVAGTNTPPTISTIPTQNIVKGTNTGPLSFTITDDHYAASNLTVTAVSSNITIIQNSGLVLAGSNALRTITVTPIVSKESNALVYIRVTNPGGASSTNFFQVIIGAPSMSIIPAQIVTNGAPALTIPFIVTDHESSPGALSVTASSSNTGLVPPGGIVLGGSGSNRTITITPSGGVTGYSFISLRCLDLAGNNSITNTFSFTVAPQLGVLFAETFHEYVDGTLLTFAHDVGQAYLGGPAVSSPWATTSGTAYLLMTTNGQAVIDQSLTEDISATLTNSPFSTNSSGAGAGTVIYYGFKMTMTALPGVTGDYFMHLKDATTTFRAKLFACTTNAASGSYRIGIANGANNPPNVMVAQDLNLNNPYNVVVRYNVGTAATTLWLNPSAETDPSVTATDAQTPSEIDQITLRQQTFEGVERVENLVVSTSFKDVAPTVLPPVISVISNQTVAVSSSTGPVSFTVTDAQTSPDTLMLGVASDNAALAPAANIVLGGSSSNRTVTVTPTAGSQGFANITIYVTNSLGGFASTHFLLTVGAPAITGLDISQIYPGGGNAGATYATKFVELFNKTSLDVSLNNWSLQYSSSNGTTWFMANFANVVVPAHSYYLVALSTNGTTGSALPVTSDTTFATINPSSTAGKFALCNNSVTLSGANPLPNANIVDLVGWGGANAYEGTAPVAWTGDNTLAMFRASGGCTDANNNVNDFGATAVVPRNSASTLNICTVVTAPPLSVARTGSNLVISWPTNGGAGFTLQTNLHLGTTAWSAVNPSPAVLGTNFVVTNAVKSTNVFYRLQGN